MADKESSLTTPVINLDNFVAEDLKLQDNHQLDVHIPEGQLQTQSLDPILESSTVDLHLGHPEIVLAEDSTDNHQSESKSDQNSGMNKSQMVETKQGSKNSDFLSSSSDENFKSHTQASKSETNYAEDRERLRKAKSLNAQRAHWPTQSSSQSHHEIVDSSETPTLPKRPSLMKKMFKAESSALTEYLSNSCSSKHEAPTIKRENSNNARQDDHESLHSNNSINTNSGNSFHGPLINFPESQSREHSVINSHREHKHESLLSKIFHFKHDSDNDRKSKVDHVEYTTSSRASACSRISVSEENPHTSTSSVEGSSSNMLEGRASVGADLRKSVVSPPIEFPKTEHSLSNTLGRLLSKKKKNHHEDREMTNNLIKELLAAQYQFPRSDTQTSQMTNVSVISSAGSSDACLADKYGHLEEVLGKGAQATVRLAHLHKANSIDKLWAVKEFRKRKKDETNREYAKRVIAEFCIRYFLQFLQASSAMRHENVIETVDLIKDEHGKWCEVMEYIPGGDMFTKISKGKFYNHLEIACFFKQFISGLTYIHANGVAHRDLKPENILLDAKHELIKITDFGVADVVRGPNERENKLSRGIAGSDPYIAPEMWDCDEYDAFKTDAWSSGILLYTMYTKTILWKAAKSTDEVFKAYRTRKTETCTAIEKLPYDCRPTMYALLEPSPAKRLIVSEILDGEWLRNTEKCSLGNTSSSDGSRFMHHHYGPG